MQSLLSERISKADFPRACEVAYMDTAAEGLPPPGCEPALLAYLREKRVGTPGRQALYALEREVGCSAARLLGTHLDNVVLLANASEGLNLLANSIDWKRGDRVLITDLEFPSNVVAWLRLREQGVDVDVIPTESGVLRLEHFLRRLDSRTRMVSVSHVSYRTGTCIPFLAALGQAAHQAGAIFCVDATQSLGRLPVGLDQVDYLVASSYKWLLGIHGLGVVYLAPELRARLQPSSAGWYSITDLFRPDRFERFDYKNGAGCLAAGMPNFPAMYALREGVEYLQRIGVERLNLTLQPLVKHLREGLKDRGFRLLTPPEPEFASGIVSFAHPDPERVGRHLQQHGVIVWYGDGRVRVSVHVYNDRSDIDACLLALGCIGPH
jgi:cysteine desulfurase / selenocysteine lyase